MNIASDMYNCDKIIIFNYANNNYFMKRNSA